MPESNSKRRLSWKALLALNAFAWTFGVGLYFVARFMSRDTYGVLYMALALPLTITVATLADAVFERIVRGDREGT